MTERLNIGNVCIAMFTFLHYLFSYANHLSSCKKKYLMFSKASLIKLLLGLMML